MDFVQVRIVFEHANEGGCGGGFRPLPLYFRFDTSLVWLVNPEIYAVDESLLYFFSDDCAVDRPDCSFPQLRWVLITVNF